jgi:hypothetical protein
MGAVIAGALVLLAGFAATVAPPAAAGAAAGHSRARFWSGTDSSTVTIPGSVPYQTPAIGGDYGGYIGMAGNWAQRCGKLGLWSAASSSQANANHAHHIGIGTGVYWFMAGPGVDPHYRRTTSEAYHWGQQQAKQALTDMSGRHVTYPVVFMDIEIPGTPGHPPVNYTPAWDNGWNIRYTSSCSGVEKAAYIPASLDRADLNGFAAYLTAHSRYSAGVYSAPSIWASIFGTGAASRIPHTYEWTYESFTSSLARQPAGWCLPRTTTCARFFGGQTSASKYALMWQWSGGGGSFNGYGDFDQIDASRTP